MVTEFNLEDFDERCRGNEWARTLPSMFPFVRLVDPPARPIYGSMRGAAFAAGHVWSMHTPAQLLRSAPANGARDNLFSMVMQQEGLIRIRQDSLECCLEPGGFCLIDGNRDFEIESATASRHVLLQIPRYIVAGRSPHLINQVGKAFAGDAGGAAMLRTLVLQISQYIGDLTPAEQAAALTSILALLGAAARPLAVDSRVEAALANIDACFSDPNLSARAVAAGQRVSRRRLDELFKLALGESVAARIWSRRLQEAADLLRARDTRSIAALALALGFEDPAHFARAFRRRYGLSPRLWRVAGASGAATPARMSGY